MATFLALAINIKIFILFLSQLRSYNISYVCFIKCGRRWTLRIIKRSYNVSRNRKSNTFVESLLSSLFVWTILFNVHQHQFIILVTAPSESFVGLLEVSQQAQITKHLTIERVWLYSTCIIKQLCLNERLFKKKVSPFQTQSHLW